jgi:hypothetical protein
MPIGLAASLFTPTFAAPNSSLYAVMKYSKQYWNWEFRLKNGTLSPKKN